MAISVRGYSNAGTLTVEQAELAIKAALPYGWEVMKVENLRKADDDGYHFTAALQRLSR